jgi:hypothetical protein
MSSDAFFELVKNLMSVNDTELFQLLSLDPLAVYSEETPSTGCKFIDGWFEWERTLRLNLAKHRSIKNKLDNITATDPPFIPVDAASASARAVTSASTPLEGEIIIDKARWDAIDNLTEIEYFDRNVVFAYYLKLMLQERRQLFDTEKGFTEYKSLYASIIESAQYVGESK